MSISTLQLGVCALYSISLWIISVNPIKLCGLQWPSRQPFPNITFDDLVKTIPVGAFFSAAHSSSVFAFSGDPIFGQIVKSGEPVLSAGLGFLFYGKRPSLAKILCLPVIVGGVAFASLKKDPETKQYALKFDQTALVFGMLANIFAAFKGNENSKLMKKLDGSPTDTYERYGGVGNQFAVTTVCAYTPLNIRPSPSSHSLSVSDHIIFGVSAGDVVHGGR